MKDFIAKIKDQARSDPKRIAFPESTEERTLKAIQEIIKEGTANPILIGNEVGIRRRITELDLQIENVQFVDHLSEGNKEYFDRYANELYEMRKEKGMTPEEARELMKDEVYYGTMMVHMGDADGLVSGAVHSTGHTVLPALQIIKAREKFHKISGAFFLKFKDEIMLFADAAVTIQPDAKDLAGIAIDSARTAMRFGLQPRVAMLSFSTKGSADHPLVKKIKEATAIAKERAKEVLPDVVIDGELQVDAAVEPWVADIKCPDAAIKGDATVLIFPDLQSANIGYKLATFFGHAEAIGPILQGLRKPVNDLSRGCAVQDIVDIVAMTVVEAQHIETGRE
ncbi:phosphate acetyltransferase [Candidatus Woesearchaeota archaeon]|jgi:phosphate acetyltransferase|nr:phosphate acetyltransferase [Candidatus Woesearchaeota archaeon]